MTPPFLPRVPQPQSPDQEAAVRRHLEMNADMWDSLISHGEIDQTGEIVFTTITANNIIAHQVFGR